jgi:hypothetical protein
LASAFTEAASATTIMVTTAADGVAIITITTAIGKPAATSRDASDLGSRSFRGHFVAPLGRLLLPFLG